MVRAAGLPGPDVTSALARFLALLVLVRHAVVEVRQVDAYAPLELRRGTGDVAALPEPEAWA